MTLHSFLFVPGDRERMLEKARAGSAHALVFDLEDSVTAERTDFARNLVKEFLLSHTDRTRQQLWVRINPLDTDLALADLASVVAGRPDGILLPKCADGSEIEKLDHYLSAFEVREGHPEGSIKIMAVSTETPNAVFALGSYGGRSTRLYGLTWGAEDLATALGASTNREPDGSYTVTFRLARSLCLLGAKSAGVQAVDTIFADLRDLEGLDQEVRQARKEGFTAKFAIHPDQVDVINAGFRLSEQEIQEAQEIVEAFRAAPDAGSLQVNGKMVDRPHLIQALQMLKAAG